MGVDFIGHGGFSLSWHAWRACFDLAVAFGWEPTGTVAPCEHAGPARWKGTYFTNDLQEITDADARALAAALCRAHAALRTRQQLTDEQSSAWANEAISIITVCDLADYAEKGHFAIS
jgi:hypothetical protein